jgi:acetyl esterase/lipase
MGVERGIHGHSPKRKTGSLERHYLRPAWWSPLAMDAYLPEGPGPFPAVIVVHGGGWEAGDKVTYVSPVLALLSRTRFA